MKPIKIFGVGVCTALMTVAFVGTSSAMAESTALCTADTALFSGKSYVTTDECPLANRISHVHDVTVGKGKLLTSSLNVECNVLFLGDVKSTNNLGAPLIIKGNLTYSSCGSCTVTEINGPGEVDILRLGHETADVTFEREVHIECFGFINCVYNGEGLQATAKGPLLSTVGNPNGEASLSEQTLTKVSGSLCASITKLDLTTTPLVATYISS